MSSSPTTRILVTGARGQIGTELITALRQRYGRDNVLATDLLPVAPALTADGPYERLDVTDRDWLAWLVKALAAWWATPWEHCWTNRLRWPTA